MQKRESLSLNLIVSIAESEAWQLRAAAIEPPHLLLALCRVQEMDLPLNLTDDYPDGGDRLEECLRETRRLRNIFAANPDPSVLRLALRRILGAGRIYPEDQDQLNLNDSSNRMLLLAGKFGSAVSHAVFPAHLLFAILLTKNEAIEKAFDLLHVNHEQFLASARSELLSWREWSEAEEAGFARWN